MEAFFLIIGLVIIFVFIELWLVLFITTLLLADFRTIRLLT